MEQFRTGPPADARIPVDRTLDRYPAPLHAAPDHAVYELVYNDPRDPTAAHGVGWTLNGATLDGRPLWSVLISTPGRAELGPLDAKAAAEVVLRDRGIGRVAWHEEPLDDVVVHRATPAPDLASTV